MELESEESAGSTVEQRDLCEPMQGERYVPRPVKRAVAARDGRRCTFVGADGRVCGSTYQLEYQHLDPVALGGAATTERLAIYCRSHNQHEARKLFGARVGPQPSPAGTST